MRTISLRSAVGVAAIMAVVSSSVTAFVIYKPEKEGYIADGLVLAQACAIVIEVNKNAPRLKIALDAKLFD